MPSLAQATIIGHAGGDPEQRYTPGGTEVVTFSIAVNDGRKQPDGTWSDDTMWVRIACFGNLAQRAREQVERGNIVTVVGRLSARPWTNRDGEPQAGIEVTANTLLVIRPKAQSEQPSNGEARPAAAASRDISLEDLPF